MAISFCVIVIFLFFARKHLYGLLYDSRKYVRDTELPVRNEQKYDVLNVGGEAKSYGELDGELDELDHLEHKSGKVDETNCV